MNSINNINLKEEPDLESDTINSLSIIFKDIIQTRECQKLIAEVAPDVIGQWAGKNIIKKLIARLAGKSIKKSFLKNSQSDRIFSIKKQVAEKSFVTSLSSLVPSLSESAKETFISFLNTIEGLPVEDKKIFFTNISSFNGSASLGTMISSMSRTVNDIHNDDPEFFSRRFEKSFEHWVVNTDFGELKELIDNARVDIVSAVKAGNSILWNYPAKVVCLLAIIPSLANIMIESVKESVSPLNNMAPDLFADVVLSLVRNVDGKSIGTLINEISEMARKLHTGNVLIGEPGKPQLPEDLTVKVTEVLDAIDLTSLLKARSLVAEMKEYTLTAFVGILNKNPELAADFLQGNFRSTGSFIQSLNRKVDSAERFFSDDELASEIAKGLNEIDAQQFSDSISRLCALGNSIHDISPELLKNFLSQIINSLDTYETGETARWLIDDIVNSLKPIAPAIMPPVIKGFAELLSPEHYQDTSEIDDALLLLRKSLLGKEAAS